MQVNPDCYVHHGGGDGHGDGDGDGGGSGGSGEGVRKPVRVVGNATGHGSRSGFAAVSKDKGKGKAVDREGEKGKGVISVDGGAGAGGEEGGERHIYGVRDVVCGSGTHGGGGSHDGEGGGGGGGDGGDDDGQGGENTDKELDGGEEEGDEEHLISDPLSDPQERKALTSALSSYFLYRRTAHLNLTHQRRKGYLGLPMRHRDILEQAVRGGGGGEGGQQQQEEDDGGYLAMLRRVDKCIARNAEIAEGIFANSLDAFGIPAELDSEVEDGGEGEGGGYGGEAGNMASVSAGTGKTKGDRNVWWEKDASNEDIDKVKSTLKQLYRDWSKEGEGERIKCYKPVLDELCSRFPLNGDGAEREEGEAKGDGDCNRKKEEGDERKRRRDQVRVLVPGAGLGRLAFDIVRAGFESQGNEFSYHQLVASNFMLNCFSHHLTRENHLRAVMIPDVHPGNLLINPTGALPQNPYTPSPTPAPASPYPSGGGFSSLPATRFSMIAGDFLQCYAGERSQGSFDAVATVFFIDTAPNVIAYIETIHRVLAHGGVWINLGPLLWHWEGRDPPKRKSARPGDEMVGIDVMGAVELTLEEVLAVVEACGFRIEKRGVHEHEHEYERAGAGGVPGEVKTGYIQDEKSMLNYEYRAQFWVAVKI